ncbi:MAG: hypothetical protein B7Z20_08970 [Sphingobium sp. 32-64-5]|nr:MAG: hypothetical protein B7Z20_08970 [Sphingobium sp. 32-64-5]
MRRLAVYCGAATPADPLFIRTAREALFTSLSDGFLTLPGGVGTMDELWEAISWAQLGYHAKPVGLLNVGGFYDQLIAFHRHMIETGFIRPGHAQILLSRDTLPPLIDAMDHYEAHDSLFAAAARDQRARDGGIRS